MRWRPEFLDPPAWRHTLGELQALGLVSGTEIEEAVSLLDPGFPFFAGMRMADSVHLHVKVDNVDDLPFSQIAALRSQPENVRPG